jgi:Family of unknown function (DUF5906)
MSESTLGATDAPSALRFTFGFWTNTSWTDRRELSWPELTEVLTAHKIGQKEGSAIVPATFRGDRRVKSDAEEIDVAFLDSDTGHTLAEIETKVRACGWTAVISSSHSHMTMQTKASRSNVDKFRRDNPHSTDADFLVEDKGMLPRVVAGAGVAGADGEFVYFEHQPCPKFRVAIRLRRPWRASDYPTQDAANAAWKERIEALAAALGLPHDQSCTDTSRLFYLPRRAATAPPPETCVIDGDPCDLFAIPACVSAGKANGAGLFGRGNGQVPPDVDTGDFLDPDTGELFDLKVWARDYGERFKIASALRARKPGVLTGRVADSIKVHCRCPNEARHTEPGTDGATFVVNAGNSNNGGFVVHCRHGHCTGMDRLGFVRLMLEQRWLSIPDLTAREFLMEESEEKPDRPSGDTSIDVLTEIALIGPDLTLKKLVDVFNRKYAVANEGGKALVMWAAFDPQMRRDRIERATFDDFRKFFCNHQFTVTVTAGGKPKKITKTYAAWWLDHPNRRQYLGGVVFDPSGKATAGSFNLWRGWSIPPTPGDWSLMSAHIHENICAGRTDISSYVIRWLAHMVQHPNQPAEVAIVMRGEKGIGKGIFGKWLLRLCGQHGLHIISAKHLTGHFTGHLRDVIFVFADEALYAGDKQHEGILKGIITEGSLLIEAKYRTAVMAANMLHLMLSSNNDWVVPASHDERRYLMLDVSSQHQRDFAYFAALDAQMEHGGLAAMLYDLAAMDLGEFRPREVPDTPELADQKLLSLDTPARWWHSVLARGFIWRSRYGHADFLCWDDFVTTELLVRSYAQWCQENRVTYPTHRTGLGRMLAAIYPSARPRAPRPVYEADSVDPQNPQPVVKLPFQHGYKLGTLDCARASFRNALGLSSAEWDSPVEETVS